MPGIPGAKKIILIAYTVYIPVSVTVMYIYNVTTSVDNTIQTVWLQWMQQIHIPEVLQTGCFTGSRLVRLLEIDDINGVTYAVQYFIEHKADYDRYIDLYAASLRENAIRKWGNKTISFRSLMEVIN